MKLYELTGQYLQLQKLADDPETPPEVLADTLEGITGEIELKAQGLLQVVRGIESDIDALDSEIARLQEMKKVRQNRIDSLRDYLKFNMQQSGITKITCPLFSITLAAGRDVVVIDDENKLPSDLVYLKRTPDKVRILAALKAGEDVPGANLGKSAESLRIK